MSAHLTLKNISFRPAKQAKCILSNINCEFQQGEIVGIIGPNGAGKSTLLNILSADLTPSTGQLTLTNIAKQATQRARQVAVLPQFSLLSFPYQVYEVIALARIPHQTGNKLDQEIINQALKAMDILPLKHRLYTSLSGGEKQRVQLARVLAQIWRSEDADQQTRLLLLDEPTTALDLGHQQQLMQAIKDFAQNKVTVIMVLHDINLAARYCHRLLALLNGKQLAFDRVANVVTEQTMEQLFSVDVQIIQDSHHHPIVISR